jgi:hypothetical protein
LVEANVADFFAAPEAEKQGFSATKPSFPVSVLADEAMAEGLAFARCACSWRTFLRRRRTDKLFAR